MADDQVTLSFNNDVFTIKANSDAGQQANYSGSVSVDYTTGSYSGLNFDVQGFGENSGFGDKGGNYGGTLGVNGNNYAVTGGGFTLYWTSMTPSSARAVLVANNNDTYDTQANPASQQSQPVSSTVNSTSDSTVCFAQGTRIATIRGDVAVEELAIGDVVVTASGAHRPIRWLGRRSYIGRFANRNPDVLPICFKAGSLADNVPSRDLYVSPKHAMFLDGTLVPAEHLVNGISITKARRVERIDYHHVELDSHDVLLAEGAASESFVDDNGRQVFHNAHEHAALYPDAPSTDAVYCAERLEHGVKLHAIRCRLDARARTLMVADASVA